jgi:hypothetical protein
MEGRHDLRKFITELPVAQRGAVLSSGREVRAPNAEPEDRAAWRDDDGEVEGDVGETGSPGPNRSMN